MDSITAAIALFKYPEPRFLQTHEAIAYFAHLLLEQGEFFTYGAITAMPEIYPEFELGFTIAQKAVNALKRCELIESKTVKLSRQGRPRIVYTLTTKGFQHAGIRELADCWRSLSGGSNGN